MTAPGSQNYPSSDYGQQGYTQQGQTPSGQYGQYDPQSGSGDGSPAKPHRNVSVGQILAGLLFVLVIVFIVENSRQVRVRLIFPEVQAPLYVPILIAAVLGGLIGSLLRYRRKKHHTPR